MVVAILYIIFDQDSKDFCLLSWFQDQICYLVISGASLRIIQRRQLVHSLPVCTRYQVAIHVYRHADAGVPELVANVSKAFAVLQ